MLLSIRFDIYRKVYVLRKSLYSYYQLFITLLRSQILFLESGFFKALHVNMDKYESLAKHSMGWMDKIKKAGLFY